MVGSSACDVAFRDVCDVDANILSRPTIGKIKDAFAEVLKKMMFTIAAGTTRAAEAAAAATGAEFINVAMTHIQDEADLRLRSFFENRPDNAPSRGRSSKVQQNVVKLFAYGCECVIPTELEALANKSAATLATTFESLLRGLMLWIFPAATEEQPQARQPRALQP